MNKIRAIIGGSGFYDLFENSEKIDINTPYGKVTNISRIYDNDKTIYFLPRHGADHSVPPHLINYKANMFALHKLNVKEIMVTNAVGSMINDLEPGMFLIPDQFIDATKRRDLTYYDGKTQITFEDGTKRENVVHLDFTVPYCPRIRNHLEEKVQENNEKVLSEGTYVCFEGPRFETPAEISMYRKLGGTVAGMTTVPEAILARELKMCYATLCLVTNFGAGMQKKVTHEEVVELFRKKTEIIRKIMKKAIKEKIAELRCNCKE